MNSLTPHFPAEVFFLQTMPGERFCIYHPPNTEYGCRGGLIYVHPFAEEMNKSRHMIALQARTLAKIGYGVLQLDLYGCGDSGGDFADARWEIWRDDLALAHKWLTGRISAPISLWGLRLGAILALDYAKTSSSKIEHIFLWQPILDTALFVTQFLRLRLANEMLSGENNQAIVSQSLRKELADGRNIEIAGYELAPALLNAIESINVKDLAVKNCPLHWFEVVPESRHSMNLAGGNLLNSWLNAGCHLEVNLVPGAYFWSTQEITECTALLTAMAQRLAFFRA